MEQRERETGLEFDDQGRFITTAGDQIGGGNLPLDLITLRFKKPLHGRVKRRFAQPRGRGRGGTLVTIARRAVPSRGRCYSLCRRLRAGFRFYCHGATGHSAANRLLATRL